MTLTTWALGVNRRTQLGSKPVSRAGREQSLSEHYFLVYGTISDSLCLFFPRYKTTSSFVSSVPYLHSMVVLPPGA